MAAPTRNGIDLAKWVFQVHAVDQHGKVVLKKELKRGQMAAFFANLPACLIGMEACGSARAHGKAASTAVRQALREDE